MSRRKYTVTLSRLESFVPHLRDNLEPQESAFHEHVDVFFTPLWKEQHASSIRLNQTKYRQVFSSNLGILLSWAESQSAIRTHCTVGSRSLGRCFQRLPMNFWPFQTICSTFMQWGSCILQGPYSGRAFNTPLIQVMRLWPRRILSGSKGAVVLTYPFERGRKLSSVV